MYIVEMFGEEDKKKRVIMQCYLRTVPANTDVFLHRLCGKISSYYGGAAGIKKESWG